jgi:hypothetical protein
MHPDLLPSVTPGDVYNFYLKAGGLATESAYPFINNVERGRKCIFNYTMDGVQILGPGGYNRI